MASNFLAKNAAYSVPPSEHCEKSVGTRYGADGECFCVRFRFLFSFPCDKYRARRAANDSFRRAPEQKMLQSAVSSR